MCRFASLLTTIVALIIALAETATAAPITVQVEPYNDDCGCSVFTINEPSGTVVYYGPGSIPGIINYYLNGSVLAAEIWFDHPEGGVGVWMAPPVDDYGPGWVNMTRVLEEVSLEELPVPVLDISGQDYNERLVLRPDGSVVFQVELFCVDCEDAAGEFHTFTYRRDFGVFRGPTPVPEPSTISLAAGGLALCLLSLWHHRR